MDRQQINIAENIKKLRVGRGVSQETVAEAMGISVQAVSKWETAASLPDIMMLPRLADYFNVPIDAIFYGVKDPEAGAAEPVPTVDAPDDIPDDGRLRIVQFVGRRCLGSDEWISGCPIRLDLTPYAGNEFSIGIWGGAEIQGDIGGNLAAGQSVTCGNVGGSVGAGGGIQCADVGGEVNAGDGVQCQAVNGSVSAGDSVTCGDVAGSVSAGDSVSCGNVAGDVDAGGDVNCGSVVMNVSAGGDAVCGPVGGSADAGGDLNCGAVAGSVTAGGDVNCGDVGGDVSSGGDVECGDVEGSVTAQGGDVTCESVRGNVKSGGTANITPDDDGFGGGGRKAKPESGGTRPGSVDEAPGFASDIGKIVEQAIKKAFEEKLRNRIDPHSDGGAEQK